MEAQSDHVAANESSGHPIGEMNVGDVPRAPGDVLDRRELRATNLLIPGQTELGSYEPRLDRPAERQHSHENPCHQPPLPLFHSARLSIEPLYRYIDTLGWIRQDEK
jgi:hypothetical protein